MRTVIDPETGELIEVLPSDVSEVEPYSYSEAKRAVMAATREKRDVLRKLEDAIAEKAEAEKEYLVVKAREVKVAKAEHGATVAEDMAKGHPEVAAAYARRDAARERVRAWNARLSLCSEDRASLHRLITWSQESDPDGWRNG